MTFETKLISMLVERGFFDNDAKQVMEEVKAHKTSESMTGRWDDDMEGYPPQMLAVLWVSAEISALDWIKANKPKAWFRPLFERVDEIPASS